MTVSARPEPTPAGDGDKAGQISDLVAGYRVWSDTAALDLDAGSQAPAATTTFCAFTVSYMFSRATVEDGC
ncbi:hypothetical protein FDO65_20590 [Nakamurella flava]|uniref:Uncharacterized protein n=1 Tax=Nakamurella flava TaxID=2576308 RepID=A0A4U6Q905_9ACTN|nr:hypothetical protein [Nakamurella flava]TKV56361.1 hypothetical protein FDO65_20590 [Nakamurella flava]